MSNYVKREDVHAIMRTLPKYVNLEIREMHGVLEMIDYDEAQRAIDRTPASDVRENVSGKWKEWWPGDCALILTGEQKLWMCSACESKYHIRSNYCPNCGAHMEEGQR